MLDLTQCLWWSLKKVEQSYQESVLSRRSCYLADDLETGDLFVVEHFDRGRAALGHFAQRIALRMIGVVWPCDRRRHHSLSALVETKQR